MSNETNELNMSMSTASATPSTESSTTTPSSTPKKIIMLLDDSGSMGCIRNDILGSVNTFIRTQKELDPLSTDTFTLTKFNSHVKHVVQDKLIVKMEEFPSTDYNPDGMTALYDAIGELVEKPSEEKDVMVVVVTDGEDTASRKHTLSSLKKLMDEKMERGWKFVYLSSDLAAFKQGAQLGSHVTACGTVNAQTNNVLTTQTRLGEGIRTMCNTSVTQFRSSGQMQGQGSEL